MNKVPIVLGLILTLFFSSPARANSSLVINEFLAYPSLDDDWVEFFNTTDDIVNLEGWKLKDTASSPIHTFTTADSVPAKGFLVYDDHSNRLNKDGDTIYLVDNNSVTVDTYTYNSSSLETSLGRSPDGGSTWVSFLSPSKGTTNGSGTPTSTPSPSVTTAGLSLSEFYPYPHSGEQEWVEIYNDNASVVSVAGFKVDDEEGGSSPITLPDDSTIPPKAYFYLQFGTGHSILNNSGDTVRFLSPDGGLIDSYTYTSATQGSSWVKRSGSWEETSTPTMGNTNQFSQALVASSTPTPTKKTVTEAPKKTTATATPTPKTDTKPEVLGEETATSTPTTTTNKIKLSFGEEDSPKVLGESTNSYLSWGLILLGLIVITIPTIIVIRKKRG